ncbi:MAG: thiamine ABC transporter substrate-binding protein [Actinobacteria bacterium]|nr:thiamine ABC transporter substrate-binding protein [Actinomycetota bacterium]
MVATLLAVVLLAAGCGGGGGVATSSASAEKSGEVVLMTHDSFALPDTVMAAFRQETGLELRVLKSGDAGSMLNQAILTKDNPMADVIFGVDNTFLSRALDEDIFSVYVSGSLADVPDEFELDPEHRVTPVDYGDVCLNYDKEVIGTVDLPLPATLADLTRPEYKGLLVVQNPATSSPGLAFLLATIAEFGESGDYPWQQFWRDLMANDVLVVSGWEEAYYSEFSGGAGEGDRPLVVSYASSPPAEAIFAETPLTEASTGVVPAGAFRHIEFAAILKGARNPSGAEKLIDFMLSISFQEAIPESMFVFPVNQNAELPDTFTRFTTIPDNPVKMDYESIGHNRERWIREWTEIAIG